MIIPLVDKSDPILRRKQSRFDFNNPPTDPIQLAKTLAESMINSGSVALTAAQIGLPYRVFCIASNPIICCFNPVIADKSTEQLSLEEGNPTFPFLLIKVNRSKIIKIRYAEPNGQYQTKKFVGLTSTIIQQQVDLLDGIMFFDSVSRLQKETAIKKANKNGCNYKISDLIYSKENQ